VACHACRLVHHPMTGRRGAVGAEQGRKFVRETTLCAALAKRVGAIAAARSGSDTPVHPVIPAPCGAVRVGLPSLAAKVAVAEAGRGQRCGPRLAGSRALAMHGVPVERGWTAEAVEGRRDARKKLRDGPDNPVRMRWATRDVDGGYAGCDTDTLDLGGIGIGACHSGEGRTRSNGENFRGQGRQLLHRGQSRDVDSIVGIDRAGLAVVDGGNAAFDRENELAGSRGCQRLHGKITGCAHERGVIDQVDGVNQEIGEIYRSTARNAVGE